MTPTKPDKRRTRRRIMPGYLACSVCDRDFPEGEFRQFTQTRKNGATKRYWVSFCRACEAENWRMKDAARRRVDAEYREQRRRQNNASYHRGAEVLARTRKAERAWRGRTAQAWLADRDPEAVARATGCCAESVRRWKRGTVTPLATSFGRLFAYVQGERADG